MLDIKFIRENKDLVQDGARKKRVDINIEEIITLDDRRLVLLREVEDKRSQQNEASTKITSTTDVVVREQLIGEMKAVKTSMQIKEEELKGVIKEWQMLMLRVPNIPDMSVPAGESEENNVTAKEWGQKPQFDFEPKDHVELMVKNGMVDFERGVKAHGFRGYFLKGDGARLSWAIWNFAREFFEAKNFEPFIAPAILKKEHFFGTGHLPGDAEDLFKTQDDDYLSGTAEVAMMAYHADEILKKEELPKRYLAFSPCYRREAGSHGKDTRGLIRVHEFYKLEQLVLCEASHEMSVAIHEELTRNNEEFIEALGLPYRRLTICTGDLKGAHVKSYDTELWVPLENKYREIASSSYYHDFQTRRFNTRYDDNGQKRYVHSLNATAIPTPRILVSLVENYQQADGSIKVPLALQPYVGQEIIRSNK
ncbi:MAG: serine--tRNA ligase [Candidatus Vogelbacteria bacterium RIFOXYD1_FULL_44_32]|uniref:Serine--tRNA ligase n=1 Tax=Candidatus Vogelbacteria bacterium RIFOXYD1_FULL_44_32 TaxID=1802438 RepID=A0A1G2QF00_9BACT|nr:MAG: serine--tRNA ligase [Candidatus Vogelbacteria bacterium RIFOXYD1_FULL_44_32]